MKSATGLARGVGGILIVTMAMVADADTFYVNGSCGNDDWTGTSSVCAAPNGPKLTIQAGIDASVNGDTVIVADGIYTGDGNRDLNFGGRLINLRSESGPDNCVIDAGGSKSDPHRGFCFDTQETREAVVDGFTIRGGYAPYRNPIGHAGGGICCRSTSGPTIKNCHIIDNFAWTGGGISIGEYSAALIVNCEIRRNSCLNDGGGVEFGGAGAVLRGCIVTDNFTPDNGGGVACHCGSVTIDNCLIARNRGLGSGFSFSRANVRVVNCTIVENIGVGILHNDSDVSVSNCILWGNAPQIVTSFGEPLVQYCDIQGGWVGTGNIFANPRFVDPESGDYRLTGASPCIDAGDNDAVSSEMRFDLGGGRRRDDEPCVADSGNGDPPIVDIGAFERQFEFTDCNANGVNDSCDLETGTSSDCNFNGVPDECDIASGESEDCNADGVPDECGVETEFAAESPRMSPIGHGSPQRFELTDPPPALGAVALYLEARGDLLEPIQNLEVHINGVHVDWAFNDYGVQLCARTSDVIFMERDPYNEAISIGHAVFDIVANSTVDPDACKADSFVKLTVSYLARPNDCNVNGVPDDCDVASGTSQDVNRNGIPDECEEPPVGDLNCDLFVNAFDVEPFMLAVFEPWDYPERYPACDIDLGDINGDGAVNSFDIAPFIELLFP